MSGSNICASCAHAQLDKGEVFECMDPVKRIYNSFGNSVPLRVLSTYTCDRWQSKDRQLPPMQHQVL